MTEQEQPILLSEEEIPEYTETIQDVAETIAQPIEMPTKPAKKTKLDANEARRRNFALGRKKKAEKKQKEQKQVYTIDEETESDSDEELIIRKKDRKEKKEKQQESVQVPIADDRYNTLHAEFQELKKLITKRPKKQKPATQIIVNPSVNNPVQEDPASAHLRNSIFSATSSGNIFGFR